MRLPTGPVQVFVADVDHAECACWDPAAGVVYAGGEAGQLYRIELDSRVCEEISRAPAGLLGLAVDGRGRVAACCREDGVQGWDGERWQVVTTSIGYANFAAFAPDGTLYVSDSGTVWGANDGRIVRIGGDGSVDVVTDRPRHFPNGLTLGEDGRTLWCVESYEPWLSRVDVASGACERVLRLDGALPDGLAPTADGGLVITCYRPDRVYHLDARGRLEVVAEDPHGILIGGPTNACFAGAGLDRLVVANLGRRHLSLVDSPLRGRPLHRPDRWAIDA